MPGGPECQHPTGPAASWRDYINTAQLSLCRLVSSGLILDLGSALPWAYLSMDVIHRIAAGVAGAEADDDMEGEVDAFNTEGLTLNDEENLPVLGVSEAAEDSLAAQKTIAKLSEAVVTGETAKTYQWCVVWSFSHRQFESSLFPIVCKSEAFI